MRKINITILLAVIAFLPLAGYAKEMIGDYVLEYDEKIEADTNNDGKNDRTTYYLGNRLVWSAYDEDGNGKPDLWLRYKNGDTVDLELHDPDGNGEPDKIAEFDYQGKREVIYDSEEEFAKNSYFGMYTVLMLIAIIGIAIYFGRNFIYKKLKNKLHK